VRAYEFLIRAGRWRWGGAVPQPSRRRPKWIRLSAFQIAHGPTLIKFRHFVCVSFELGAYLTQACLPESSVWIDFLIGGNFLIGGIFIENFPNLKQAHTLRTNRTIKKYIFLIFFKKNIFTGKVYNAI